MGWWRNAAAPGVLSRTIDVAVSGDAVLESDESFQVVLGAPGGESIAQPQETATIDDDADSVIVGVAPASAADASTRRQAAARARAWTPARARRSRHSNPL